MPKAKLTKEERLAIVDDLRAGKLSFKEISARYGVSAGTTSYYAVKAKVHTNGHRRIKPIVLGSTIDNARSSKEQVAELVDLLWTRLPLTEKLAMLKGISR